MTDQGEAAVKLIFDACRYFGASLVTAHRVAALAAEDIEWFETGSATRSEDSDG
jgi:hypothetical protein